MDTRGEQTEEGSVAQKDETVAHPTPASTTLVVESRPATVDCEAARAGEHVAGPVPASGLPVDEVVRGSPKKDRERDGRSQRGGQAKVTWNSCLPFRTRYCVSRIAPDDIFEMTSSSIKS